jgi:hypothetical protein
MKHAFQFALLLCAGALAISSANAQWRCLYATWDDDQTDINAIGSNPASVGVIKENMFVALVSNPTECYPLPYVNADSGNGRKYSYGYGSAATGQFYVWSDGGFDQVSFLLARKVKAMKDSLIYVSNNDPDHNLLVLKYYKDTVTVVPVPGTGVYPRQQTGTNPIFGVEVDTSGYVYVCNDTSTGVKNDLKIYKPIKQWTSSHTDAPIATIDLPDGIYRGLGVSPDGKQLFVCDYANRKVLKYKGSPATGYTADAAFSFTMSAADTFTNGVKPGPLGLAYLPGNNILAVACQSWRGGGAGYTWGRVYFLNPNNGAYISADTNLYRIDEAMWNFIQTGRYNNRPNGTTPGNASGYSSVYDVKFDEKKNLYTQSYYGWTVEKWAYNGTLPVIVVTGVEEIGAGLPTGYALSQNYPNPFNPATTIDFSVPASGFVSLKVFDLLGREVATLVDEQKAAGSYRATFDATSLPSGTYFYALKAGSYSGVKKMALVK